MKKSRIFFTVLALILSIPLTSVIYKMTLRFYDYKNAMATYVVPRGDGLSVETIVIRPENTDMTQVMGLQLFSHWSPTVFTNQYNITGVRINLPHEQVVTIYPDLFSTPDIREWMLVRNDSAVVALEKAYGDWNQVESRFPSAYSFLDTITGKQLPDYFDLSSVSMQYPFGFYMFPLFPEIKNYRIEYALFAVKATQADNELPFLRLKSDAMYFFVFQSSGSVEILYGDAVTGALMGQMVLASEEGVLTQDLIADVCFCIEESFWDVKNPMPD